MATPGAPTGAVHSSGCGGVSTELAKRRRVRRRPGRQKFGQNMAKWQFV